MLETKLKNSLIAIVKSGVEVTGSKWLLRRVISFARSRKAADALVQAMQHLLTQPALNDQAHFIELLSCLKSMILFDDYRGNEASSKKVLGTHWERGCLHRFLSFNPKINMRDLGIDFQLVFEQAHNHIKELERQLTYIAEQVNADDNGVNFAIKTTSNDGKCVRILFAGYSNYMKATEFVSFKQMNAGRHFLTKNDWLFFVRSVVVPKFTRKTDAFKDGVELDDNNGKSFLDFSIKKIKNEENSVHHD